MNSTRRNFLLRSGLASLGSAGLLLSACGGGGRKSSYSYQGYQFERTLFNGDGPRWLNYGPSGTILVGEHWKRSIHIVSQQGVTRRTIHVPGDLLLNPEECAVSSSGVIHVCDPTENVVRRYKPDGSELASILTGFGNPTGIEIAKNGKIYIIGNTGEDRQRVTVADSDGNVLDRLVPPDGTSFNDARGITSDSENNVYVADFLNARIVKYDALGRHSLTINDVSSYGINVDVQDNLVVTDFLKRKVVVFSGTGTVLSEFTGRETGPGNFFEPSTALVMPDGRLYVSDFVINEVTIWKPA